MYLLGFLLKLRKRAWFIVKAQEIEVVLIVQCQVQLRRLRDCPGQVESIRMSSVMLEHRSREKVLYIMLKWEVHTPTDMRHVLN